MKFKLNGEINIPVEHASVTGALTIPVEAKSIVIFAHGSGSSRFSSRNKKVADFLLQQNLGTLLFDLLTKEEDTEYQNRFNIELLATRLIKATEWLQIQADTKGLYYGYFGASTGAAAALIAASLKPQITAVVSRGGRPDLAMSSLQSVRAPTLLIVGSKDVDVLRLNQKAYDELRCQKELVQVEGATHLFEEPGTLEQVSKLAADWFTKHEQPAH